MGGGGRKDCCYASGYGDGVLGPLPFDLEFRSAKFIVHRDGVVVDRPTIRPTTALRQYSCPAGLSTSEEFDWIKDIVGLLLYVYTLYSRGGDNVGLRDIWLSIADHEIGTSNDNRVPVIQLNKWAKWLHKDLGFVAPLMVSLTRQVRPEWGLLRPPPRPLHLHEAMQRLILEHVNTWETKELNVQLDTHTPRSYPKVERVPKAPGRHYPIIGQIHRASSLGKRVSHTLAGPGPKRRRKTNIRLPDGPLPPLPPLGMAWATLFGPPQPLLHSSEDDYGDEDEETSD
ncbi:hypothetical protein PC9H_004391 [Pleurotus ostreatus]|uniref:Uncharacterized protein n=1 Tax=Pleurotus ostreatus TaxID=5322 RepID=A0A8H7A382_PLEOS|nr:uncharacterized protein PC9H_004391 [Pleurotus ostreatus]KAF7437549.1 hypothetical protein PC9H_004391 [Pleurotus ostreatus]KAJ8703503.1 hypothetical protein PTI98_002121 [Pleurotus ostreatus]